MRSYETAKGVMSIVLWVFVVMAVVETITTHRAEDVEKETVQ